MASLVAGLRFSAEWALAVTVQAPVVVTQAWMLESMWKLPGPGTELVCQHWRVDSYPQRHPRSPILSS